MNRYVIYFTNICIKYRVIDKIEILSKISIQNSTIPCCHLLTLNHLIYKA
jgi:hypothetical protein